MTHFRTYSGIVSKINSKVSGLVMEYLWNIQLDGNGDQWIQQIVDRHYGFDYRIKKRQQIENQQFNKDHWMTLRVKIGSISDLQHYKGTDRVHVKLKMSKPSNGSNGNGFYRNPEVNVSDKMQGMSIDQDFLYCLKFEEISITKFIITVITECEDTQFDGEYTAEIVLNDLFYSEQCGKRVAAIFDLFAANEECGGIEITFEIMEFNPVHHMNVNYSSKHAYGSMEDDRTPLISHY